MDIIQKRKIQESISDIAKLNKLTLDAHIAEGFTREESLVAAFSYMEAMIRVELDIE